MTTNQIRELVCNELSMRNLNKYRNLFVRKLHLEDIGFNDFEKSLTKNNTD